MTEKFIDPLEALVNKHKNAMSLGQSSETTSDNLNDQPVVENVVDSVPTLENVIIDYGDNDLADEIAKEEAAEEEAKKKMRESLVNNEKPTYRMPPDEHDPAYHTEAIDFQTNKLVIVDKMVNEVVKKNNLPPGGIPNENNYRMKIMGELVDIYHKTGDVITPEFEKLIVDNWVPTESNVKDNTPVNNNLDVIDENNDPTNNQSVVEEKQPDTPTINITVDKHSPVTVNIDESVTAELTKSNQINIHVKEVSEDDLYVSTIIENSQMEGIIEKYDPGVNDVPITLPLSGYRCVMRPINWLDFIKLTSPTSQNTSDAELKKWTVIYEHMKNPSIGEFENFEDFLKKTKYSDKDLLLWALLVATADEEETIILPCPNKKCGKDIVITYNPRSIAHIDPDLIPSHYAKTHDVPPGPAAVRHWESINGRRRRYVLPNTGVIAEINEPSAYDFITDKLSIISKLYERYKPGERINSVNPEDPELFEFDYISANVLYVSALTIVKDDKEYRFTNWEDIEKIISTALDITDANILLKLIEKTRKAVSPISFYVPDIKCSSCDFKQDKLVIENIAETLLFQVSRRLTNTTINLIEMD